MSDDCCLDLAKVSGAGLTRRGSVRLSFDAFQCKSRPGLSVSESEAQTEQEHESMRTINARIVGKKKERKYGNVRRRNSSWSEQQKSKKLSSVLTTDARGCHTAKNS